MPEAFRVEFATAAEHGVISLEHYLTPQCGLKKAAEMVDQLVMQIVTALSSQAMFMVFVRKRRLLGSPNFVSTCPSGSGFCMRCSRVKTS